MRRHHDSSRYTHVHICDEELHLYIHNLQNDDCETVELTPNEARVLSEQLKIAADYFEANVLKETREVEA
jgi:hypothetical protein